VTTRTHVYLQFILNRHLRSLTVCNLKVDNIFYILIYCAHACLITFYVLYRTVRLTFFEYLFAVPVHDGYHYALIKYSK